MMIAPKQQFPDNARVKIRDNVHSGFYGGYGLPGNVGWIREHREEKYGYHQVLVEWDKDHWAYNGQPDGWTWEGHFEQAEESKMGQDKNDMAAALQALALTFAESVVDVVSPQDTPKSAPEEVRVTASSEEDYDRNGPVWEIHDASRGEKDESLTYTQALEAAADAASDAEGFILVAVKTMDMGGVQALSPVVYHAAKDMKSSILCNLQLSHISSNFTDHLASDAIYEVMGGDDMEDNE